MKKLITVLASGLIISSIPLKAQEKAKHENHDGKLKIVVVKDENGKVSEYAKSFSTEESGELKVVLDSLGVELDLKQLIKDCENGMKMFDVDVETTVSQDGEESPKAIKVFRMKKGDSLIEETISKIDFHEFEGEEGYKVIKMTEGNEDDNKNVMVFKLKGEDGDFEFGDGKGHKFFIQSTDSTMNWNSEDGTFKVLRTVMVVKKEELTGDKKGDKPTSKISLKKVEGMSLSNFNLFPNPTNGKFKMQFSMSEPTLVELTITDIKGTQIYSKSLADFQGEYQEEFDLSDYDSGVYFFNVIANGEKISNKIVLQ